MQETGDRQNFQGRYVIRHPFKGADTCGMAAQYRASLIERQEREVKTLANLTGWDIDDIRAQIPGLPEQVDEPWWKTIWN